MRHCLTLALLLGSVSTAAGQSLAARPEDVATIDGIIKAFYDVISGPAGQPRQWQRDSTLYIPRVQFVAMSVENGKPVPAVMDHGTFAARYNSAFVDRGFFERETKRVTKRFGNIAHVFSAYEYRASENGPVQGRGVNSIQLYWDGTRWWIASAIWDDERPDNPIPAELR
jgi:hypothetical protein